LNKVIRPGTLADNPGVYAVFVRAIADLERRMGTPEGEKNWTDPAFIADYWKRRQPLFDHLARTAEQFWVAEDDGQIVGFARTTLSDGVRQLTEFFVLPGNQSAGVGRELLARAFPARGARNRAIIATSDIRALARYLKSGVYPRFPIYFFYGKPGPVRIDSDLVWQRVTATPETLAALCGIDRMILGFERDVDHEFLLNDREAYLFTRGERVAGYGYSGNGTGPIALLDESDFPAVLARVETEAASHNEPELEFEVPLINRAAVNHLLGRGFQMEPFTVFLMSDQPFGKFENYICTSPPFFV
jgi:GNAT superfamily N-acetyltransferase